jgi:hypothetical protein
MGSREIAQSIVADARDHKLITDVTRRASKALRILKLAGDVRSSVDTKGKLLWTLRRYRGDRGGDWRDLGLRGLICDQR